MPKLKLLFVTNAFPTPVEPRRGIFTYQLVKHLEDHFDMTVVCPLPWFPATGGLSRIKKYQNYSLVPPSYAFNGITVFSPKYPLIPRFSESLHASLMYFGIARCLKRLHSRNHFQAVNSHWLYPDSAAVERAAHDLGIPHIATGMGCDVNHDIYDPAKRSSLLALLKSVMAVTVKAESLKQVLINNGANPAKISVIPNGVDTTKFRILDQGQCRTNLGLTGRNPLILYVGRLSEEKNVATLIRAIAQLVSSGEIIDLAVVGSGPLDNELTRLSNELGVNGNVRFYGDVDHETISTWMGAADYFCLPSFREGCPNVVLEALACGKPVIASRVGAIPDFVSASNGILFNPENLTDVVTSITSALATDWDPLAISRTVQDLSWDATAANYARVIHAVAKPSAGISPPLVVDPTP